MPFKEDAKQWFETGDYPTEAQFAQVFEWLRWKDEGISITSITNLQSILNAHIFPVDAYTVTGTHNYTIPNGFLLEKIILKPLSDTSCRVDTLGTSIPGDIVMELPILAAGDVLVINKMAYADLDIVLYGLPAGSKVFYIKKKIY